MSDSITVRIVNSQSWSIPIRLQSYANMAEHWRRKVQRKKKHNELLDAYFFVQQLEIKPPCRITLVRVAPRKLDDDNLRFAFKNVLDRIGKYLMPEKKVGHADGSGLIQVDYQQTRGKPNEYKINIIIEEI